MDAHHAFLLILNPVGFVDLSSYRLNRLHIVPMIPFSRDSPRLLRQRNGFAANDLMPMLIAS